MSPLGKKKKNCFLEKLKNEALKKKKKRTQAFFFIDKLFCKPIMLCFE
jgi:hypothetical protein